MTALTVETLYAKTIQAGAGTAGRFPARTVTVSVGNSTRHIIQWEAARKEEGARLAARKMKGRERK